MTYFDSALNSNPSPSPGPGPSPSPSPFSSNLNPDPLFLTVTVIVTLFLTQSYLTHPNSFLLHSTLQDNNNNRWGGIGSDKCPR